MLQEVPLEPLYAPPAQGDHEEEDAQGQTRMSVLVSPELGEVDEEQLVRTILAELAKENDSQRMMARVWADAGTLRVRRERPLTTARGKLLPLHIAKGG